MTKRTRIILLAGGTILIVVFLTSPRLKPLLSVSGGGTSNDARDPRLPVTAVRVTPKPITNTILATGTLRANEEVELKSEATGRVVNIVFTEGARVRRGELLIKIDDSELRAERAKLESHRKVAQEKERRRKQLYEKQNISSEDYELAVNELNAINAELELINARIRKTEILAPFNGLIGLRYASEGSYVSPAIRIASLQNISKLKIDFSVPEKYAGAVKRGQKVYFRLAGRPRRFEGTIFAIEPKIDPQTRSLLIRAVCANERENILPGGFAEVELVLEQIADALMVPAEAIVPDLQGQKVYLSRNGVAEEVRVDVGLRTESEIRIVKGIQPGDTVLTSGLLQVIPGTPVRLTEVK
ncbi:MAG: efflux RND transporter periplasmic adaptor subunit [Bacteroidota bacterium]